MDLDPLPGVDDLHVEEVTLVACGIATAVAPENGLTHVQADLLEVIASASTGVSVDHGRSIRSDRRSPPEAWGKVISATRRRIVRHVRNGVIASACGLALSIAPAMAGAAPAPSQTSFSFTGS